MTPNNQIEEIRNQYLRRFAESCATATNVGESLVIEAAYRGTDGSLAREGKLDLPLRGDIFLVANGQTTRSLSVDSEDWPSFAPIDFQAGPTQVSLLPFPWDACDLTVSGLAAGTDWAPLKKWFEKWFNVADNCQPDEEGFNEVVHFMSDPVEAEWKTTVQVDFGSAPVVAFNELLAVFQQLGATSVEVGQKGVQG
jgi:hypothetical protein